MLFLRIIFFNLSIHLYFRGRKSRNDPAWFWRCSMCASVSPCLALYPAVCENPSIFLSVKNHLMQSQFLVLAQGQTFIGGMVYCTCSLQFHGADELRPFTGKRKEKSLLYCHSFPYLTTQAHSLCFFTDINVKSHAETPVAHTASEAVSGLPLACCVVFCLRLSICLCSHRSYTYKSISNFATLSLISYMCSFSIIPFVHFTCSESFI